jgi:hypothetical protein
VLKTSNDTDEVISTNPVVETARLEKQSKRKKGSKSGGKHKRKNRPSGYYKRHLQKQLQIAVGTVTIDTAQKLKATKIPLETIAAIKARYDATEPKYFGLIRDLAQEFKQKPDFISRLVSPGYGGNKTKLSPDSVAKLGIEYVADVKTIAELEKDFKISSRTIYDYARRNGWPSRKSPTHRGNSKYSIEEEQHIRDKFITGAKTIKQLQDEYGPVSNNTIRRIVTTKIP